MAQHLPSFSKSICCEVMACAPIHGKHNSCQTKRLWGIPPQSSLPHPAHLTEGSQAPVPNTQEELCRLGLCCSICIQSTHKPESESDWEEDDWNGEIAREKDR